MVQSVRAAESRRVGATKFLVTFQTRCGGATMLFHTCNFSTRHGRAPHRARCCWPAPSRYLHNLLPSRAVSLHSLNPSLEGHSVPHRQWETGDHISRQNGLSSPGHGVKDALLCVSSHTQSPLLRGHLSPSSIKVVPKKVQHLSPPSSALGLSMQRPRSSLLLG